MKKIRKAVFRNRILGGNELLLKDGAIEEIEPSEVQEFRLGKKYFYKLLGSTLKKDAQSRLVTELLSLIPISNAATAYRKNHSYLNFLEPHRGNYHFLRLDIRSFFHSIRINHIRNAFESYFEDEEISSEGSQKLIDSFLALTCYKVPETSPNTKCAGREILPIGFSTSPTISNIIFRQIDIHLQKYCSPKDITYSRYADDLLFSANESSKFVHSNTFETEVQIAVSRLDLEINEKKTKKCRHTISLNGYVIQSSDKRVGLFSPMNPRNSEIRISNKKTNTIKKLVHMITVENKSPRQIMEKTYGFNPRSQYPGQSLPAHIVDKYAKDQLFSKLAGYRSYLISIVKFDKEYQCVNNVTILKYQSLISLLNGLLDKWK
jgi:hypothetical protein